MYKFKQTIVIIFLSIFSISASAALVLEQSPLDGGDGSFSVGPAGVQIAADNFQFPGNVLLTNISWWGSYDPITPVTESFTVRIFEDDGFGNPEINALLDTTFTGSGDNSDGLFDLFGAEVLRYDVSANQLLQGGVDYYLSVFNNDDSQDWFWLESASGSGSGWSRAADGDSWSFDSSALNMSFRLTADPFNVPEPNILLLMLMGLAFLGIKGNKKTSI